MKSSRVFWQYVVLWVGAIVALSLIARMIPGHETGWLGLRYGPTYTAALLERISGAIVIAAFPAGLAASRYVLSWGRIIREHLIRFAVASLAASVLVFVLVGFVAPYAARSEDPSPTPRLAAYSSYYSFNELLSASAHFREQAELGTREGGSYFHLRRQLAKAERLEGRFYFVIMWSLAPALFAWIGVLTRLWTSSLRSQERALAEWLTALVLLLGIQFTVSGAIGWENIRWGASPLIFAGTGRGLLIVPAVLLITLGGTTAIARKSFKPAPA